MNNYVLFCCVFVCLETHNQPYFCTFRHSKTEESVNIYSCFMEPEGYVKQPH